jgi:hypothetical protein
MLDHRAPIASWDVRAFSASNPISRSEQRGCVSIKKFSALRLAQAHKARVK